MLNKFFKVLMTYLLGGSGTMIFCPKCGSPKTRFGKSEIYLEGDYHERYSIECKECGSTGIVTEVWKI